MIGILQYDINRESAKLSALSSFESNKYKYLHGEKMLPSDERRMIEQATFYPFFQEKLWRNKQKLSEIKGKKKLKV